MITNRNFALCWAIIHMSDDLSFRLDKSVYHRNNIFTLTYLPGRSNVNKLHLIKSVRLSLSISLSIMRLISLLTFDQAQKLMTHNNTLVHIKILSISNSYYKVAN